MTWCNGFDDFRAAVDNPAGVVAAAGKKVTASLAVHVKMCPSCGYRAQYEQETTTIRDLPGLPAGVKFDPTDQELLKHLEGKARPESRSKLHPLVDDFIPTIEGENGICYTHPERLPGVSKDGLPRHFFHRPSRAYTTGTRKRRKVRSEDEAGAGVETRWHKTGKTRPVLAGGGRPRGYKKILVLYTSYGKQRKPEKTSWVMHQYHLGSDEEERDGELVVSKVFFQTQPRQCGGSTAAIKDPAEANDNNPPVVVHKGFEEANVAEEYCYNSTMMIGYGQGVPNNNRVDHYFMPNFAAVHAARAAFGP